MIFGGRGPVVVDLVTPTSRAVRDLMEAEGGDGGYHPHQQQHHQQQQQEELNSDDEVQIIGERGLLSHMRDLYRQL